MKSMLIFFCLIFVQYVLLRCFEQALQCSTILGMRHIMGLFLPFLQVVHC